MLKPDAVGIRIRCGLVFWTGSAGRASASLFSRLGLLVVAPQAGVFDLVGVDIDIHPRGRAQRDRALETRGGLTSMKRRLLFGE